MIFNRSIALALAALATFSFSEVSGQICGNSTKLDDSTEDKRTLQHEGRTRYWYPYVPESLLKDEETGKVPVVLVVHGYEGCSDSTDYMYWRKLSNEIGFMTIFPQGLEGINEEEPAPSWNAGEEKCCGGSGKEGVDDVGFLRKVIQDTIDTLNGDASRVYLAGHSNGCAMVQRLAVEANDLVTAVGCHSFYLLTDNETNYKVPVPILEIHGTADEVTPYDNKFSFLGWPSADKNIKGWAERNGCDKTPNSYLINFTDGSGFNKEVPPNESNLDLDANFEGSTFISYNGCKDNADVSLISLKEVGHFPFPLWFKNEKPDTTRMAWDFLSQFQRVGNKLTKVNSNFKVPVKEADNSGVRMKTAVFEVLTVLIIMCSHFA